MVNHMDSNRIVDVICQHKRDGTIIPIKIRLSDDDGEFQTYKIKAFKDLTHYGEYIMPNNMSAATHMWKFECRINVFDTEKTIKLFYNAIDNCWRVSFG